MDIPIAEDVLTDPDLTAFWYRVGRVFRVQHTPLALGGERTYRVTPLHEDYYTRVWRAVADILVPPSSPDAADRLSIAPSLYPTPRQVPCALGVCASLLDPTSALHLTPESLYLHTAASLRAVLLTEGHTLPEPLRIALAGVTTFEGEHARVWGYTYADVPRDNPEARALSLVPLPVEPVRGRCAV